MLKDYKSRSDLRTMVKPRRGRRFGRILLLGLIISAALYASQSVLKEPSAPNTQATASTPPSRIETDLSLPVLSRTNPAGDENTSSTNQSRQQDGGGAADPIDTAEARPESKPAPAATTTPSPLAAALQNKAKTVVESEAGGETRLSLTLPGLEIDELVGTAEEPGTHSVPATENSAYLDSIEENAVLEDSNPSAVDISGRWIEEQVKPGDSLAKIFSRLDLSASLLHRIVNSSKEAKSLAHIKPGEVLRVRVDDEGQLLELIHQRSQVRSLQILPAGDSFKARKIERNLDKRVTHASGTITSSLYESAKRAGLTDTLVMELANIFGWDVDFALEIRSGDRFSLIYEEEYLDGEKYGNGAILAAEFVNQGKVFRAVRYQDEQDHSSYFSPDGNSMRKAFLRAPVDFRRISSRFTRSRWHPVLGKKRPHRGVDYAAAIGTPIKAAGDGRVVFRGRKGGYGNTVIIKHGSQYTTLYGHLSKFRSKVKNGSRVRQGQTIGYVGKTGLATGPHLHYEFRVNGTHRNPLTVKLPAAAPIKEKYRADFSSKSAPLLARLDLISETMVAKAE